MTTIWNLKDAFSTLSVVYIIVFFHQLTEFCPGSTIHEEARFTANYIKPQWQNAVGVFIYKYVIYFP
ncbi:hypothetical protein UACE39S_02505 [Ureibacillus acetophenoni]